jgi:hypothetical protein
MTREGAQAYSNHTKKSIIMQQSQDKAAEFITIAPKKRNLESFYRFFNPAIAIPCRTV